MRCASQFLVVLFLFGCCRQQWTPGALMANGSEAEVLGNVNGSIYSMHGFERISRAKLKPISLVHILLFEPNVETRGGGSGLSTECLNATETLTWKLGNYKAGPFDLPDAHFEIHFDGKDNKIQIGGQSYDGGKGNLFVVWLDQKWKPRVKQVARTIKEQQSVAEILDEFKLALPSETDVQAAKLHSQVRR